MWDRDVVDLCARCLAEAARHDGAWADLTLAAGALADDLAGVFRGDADALLGAAWREAISMFDASDLDREAFATVLTRLDSLISGVRHRLAALPAVA